MNIKVIEEYCDMFDAFYNKIARRKYTDDELKLYMSDDIQNHPFLNFDLEKMKKEGKRLPCVYDFENQKQCITDSEKESIIEEFCNLMHQAAKTYSNDFNTFSGIFVCCCNFMVIHAINKIINSFEELINRFCSFEGTKQNKEFLRLMGNGIFLREIDSQKSIDTFLEAIEIYPNNEVALIYKFIIASHNCDKYIYQSNNSKAENYYNEELSDTYAKLSSDLKNIVLSKFNNNILLPSYNAVKYRDHEYTTVDFLNNKDYNFDTVALRKWLVFINETLYINNATYGEYLDLYNLYSKLKNISQMLLEVKSQSGISSLNPASEEFEIEVSKIINALSQKVSGSLTKSDLDDAEENLKLFFGDNIWNGLEDGTKTSLKSASFLMKSCNELSAADDMDYSGICICATSALEREIKRVFYYGFKKYCESLPENPIPFTMANSEGSSFINENNFTLGSFRYALGDYPKNRWNAFDDDKKDKVTKSRRIMSEYLKEHLVSETNCDPIDKFRKSKSGYNYSFLKQCEDIKERYRNPAAHTDRIKRKEAQDCYDSIVGKSMGEQHIEDVKGVLKYLYEIIDISTIDISES